MTRRTILDKIIAFKSVEVEKRKRFFPLKSFINRIPEEKKDFKSALRKGKISIIAEIKRMSPSAGIIRRDFDPIKIAREYKKGGVSAISILTDGKFFWGKNSFLTDVRKEFDLPLLRKEFIIDEYQIYESAYIGADAILLIVKILDRERLEKYIKLADKLGLSSLIEVHSGNELQTALSTSAEIIGINNRNLETFKTSLEKSINMKTNIPDKYITVSESGIKTRDDILKLEKAGFDSVLIGETLMKQKNIRKKLKELQDE